MTGDSSPEPEDAPGEGQKYKPNSPIGAAMVWVSRILTVVVLMIAPGLAGQWLDEKWGTNFLVLVGFVFGLTAGIYYLLKLTGTVGKKRP